MREQRYVYGSKEIPSYLLRRQPATERAKIKKVGYIAIDKVGYIAIDKVGGSRGIKYLYRTKIENRSKDDWMSFLEKKSNGFYKHQTTFTTRSS